MTDKVQSVAVFILTQPRETPYLGATRGDEAPNAKGYFVRRGNRTVYPIFDRSVLVRITTADGVVGWGETYGLVAPGAVGAIIGDLLADFTIGQDPTDPSAIYDRLYDLMRVRGYTGGFYADALAAIDIALWDIAGKVAGLPLHKLIGGAHRDRVKVYGYGMMLKREGVDAHIARFADEAAAIRDAGFVATKMKVGLGVRDDIRLCEAVRRGVGDAFDFMVDANHCYTTPDALTVGRALDDLGAYWFEEPVAPEDLDGYRELRARLKTHVSGGEAEFGRWGWRALLENRGLDIAQPEVCALGGVSEYLRVLALCHAHFTPVVNHVWGSAVAVATNLHLLAAMPDLPGGLNPWEPMLEFDTTHNAFRDELLIEPLDIAGQVKSTGGYARIPSGPGLGIEPDPEFIKRYEVDD